MARVTVADCIEIIPNIFHMTLVAIQRARDIEQGSEILVKHRDGDKATVIALREIAYNKLPNKLS